jgi:NADH-quinone oxidoreductase subunit E
MPLSEELRARITAEFPKYPEKRAVLLSALHFIQAECEGWIPPDTIGELAEILELPRIDVEEVISFYPMYHTERVGRCHIQVCTNLPCCLAGARGVVRALEKELDLGPGEVSGDGVFSIGEAECLGSCGTAPVIQVNNEPYLENVKAGDVPQLLGRLRARDAERRGGQR